MIALTHQRIDTFGPVPANALLWMLRQQTTTRLARPARNATEVAAIHGGPPAEPRPPKTFEFEMTTVSLYLLVGLATLAASWLPLFLRERPISLPIVAVSAGWLLGRVGAFPTFAGELAPLLEQLSALVLLAAIHGAGLRIDRPFRISSWSTTWRLLLIVMPLSIAALTVAGLALPGISLGTAVILAAALAPTDPVLASEVQVGPPGTGDEGEARFGLTTEAGLNDGMAFPFVMLGVTLLGGGAKSGDLAHWAAVELLASTAGGAALGITVGLGLIGLNALLPKRYQIAATQSGLVGMALALTTYGICKELGVNGFVAVFCQAVAIRNFPAGDDHVRRVSHATAQIERAFMVLALIAFGLALSRGLLSGFSPWHLVFAGLALLVVRPACTALSLVGSGIPAGDRIGMSYFGIRGLGSLYYASYLAANHPAAWLPALAAPLAVTVLASIFLYGVTGRIVARRLVGRSAKP